MLKTALERFGAAGAEVGGQGARRTDGEARPRARPGATARGRAARANRVETGRLGARLSGAETFYTRTVQDFERYEGAMVSVFLD